jgi:transposase
MKARIALEAIKEQKTIQEIASHYGVHPSHVTNWKRQAIQGASELLRIGGRSRTRARKR